MSEEREEIKKEALELVHRFSVVDAPDSAMIGTEAGKECAIIHCELMIRFFTPKLIGNSVSVHFINHFTKLKQEIEKL